MCREQGIALHELAAQNFDDDFGVFGVVKEINVDDDGLNEFSVDYFPGRDLYLDSDKSFYAALGDRKLSIPFRALLNPFGAYRYMKDMNKRLAQRKIEGNLKGEGLKQGGVIVFDASGAPRYAYLEETGSELPAADILSAIQAVREEQTGSAKEKQGAGPEL